MAKTLWWLKKKKSPLWAGSGASYMQRFYQHRWMGGGGVQMPLLTAENTHFSDNTLRSGYQEPALVMCHNYHKNYEPLNTVIHIISFMWWAKIHKEKCNHNMTCQYIETPKMDWTVIYQLKWTLIKCVSINVINLHFSWAGIKDGSASVADIVRNMAKTTQKMICETDTLIIDEVSMVSKAVIEKVTVYFLFPINMFYTLYSCLHEEYMEVIKWLIFNWSHRTPATYQLLYCTDKAASCPWGA